MINPSIVATLNRQCAEVVEDLVHSGGFAITENVILVLLQRYQLPSFDCLMAGSPASIPFLHWLIAINTKVLYSIKMRPDLHYFYQAISFFCRFRSL